MGRGHTGHNLGSYQDFTQYVPNHMRPFLFGYHFILLHFCTQCSGGHDFWPHLEMCHKQSDPLLVILNNGTVGGEMRS